MADVWGMKPGEVREVVEISNADVAVKLIEMGCLPGTQVTFNYRAPLGDPICITLGDYDLSLRKAEAQAITVR